MNYITPAVVYTRVKTDPANDLDGSPVDGFAMFQISVYDPSHLSALELASTIRRSLCAWTSETVQGVTFQDERGFPDDTSQTRHYHVSQDYMIYTTLD